MKQINVKLLGILFLCTVTTLVGAFFLYRYQKGRNAAGLLRRVDAKIAEGDISSAKDFLLRYCSLRPNDAEQFAKLAGIMREHVEELRLKNELSGRSFGQAYAVAEEAVRKNPDDRKLREETADFALKYGRFPDAISHLTRLMEGEGANDPDLQVKLARCYIFSGQEDKAVPTLSAMVGYDRTTRTFDASRATAPENLEAYQLLAGTLISKMSDQAAGLAVIDQAVKANPEAFEAYILRAVTKIQLRVENSFDQVQADIEKSLELAPEEAGPLLLAGEQAMRRREIGRARELFMRCKELHPENYQAYRMLAELEVGLGDVDDAIDVLNEGLETSKDNTELLWQRARFELSSGKIEAAEATREKLAELKYPRPYLDMLDGQLALTRKDWLRATKKLEEARPQMIQLGDTRADLVFMIDQGLAAAYERLGQNDLRLQAIKRISDTRPDNVNFRWELLKSYLAMGQLDKAAAEYDIVKEKIAGTPAATNPQLLAVRLQMELLQQSRKAESNRSYLEAKEIVSEINSQGLMKDPSIARLVENYFKVSGNEEGAEKIREYITKSRPNDPNVILTEVVAIANDEGVDAALARLDKVSGTLGDPLTVRLVRSELLARVRPDEAKEQLRILEADVPSLAANRRDKVARAIATIYISMNDIESARRVYQELAKDRPQDIQIRLALFELAIQSNEEEGMESAIASIASLTGTDSAEWEWAEGTRILWKFRRGEVDKSELENAHALVEKAIRARDGWDALHRLKGEILMSKGETLSAIESLERSLEISMGNPMVFRNLVLLYYQTQQLDSAERMLKRLPASLWNPLIERINMDILSQRGELPEDLPYDKDSTDPTTHLWVGKLLTNSQRYEQAEAAFRKAIELKPESPEAWAALVKLYVGLKDETKAREAIKNAQLELSEKDSPIFLGETYSMLNDWESASKYYAQAMEADPSEVRIQRALCETYIQARDKEAANEIVDRILKDAVPHDPNAGDDVRWARRTKAKILADEGAYYEFAAARKIIEENAPKKGALSPVDMLLWARLSAARADAVSRKEAITKLELAEDKRRLTNEERRVLADLYQRQDQWSQCKSVMLDLLAANPKDMTLLEPWLTWLLDRGEVQDAAKWVDNCPPGSVVAVRTKAQLMTLRGDTEGAAKMLMKLVPQDLNEQNADQLRLVVGIMDGLGKYDERMYTLSEKLLRRYVDLRPAESIALADFLRRRGRTQEAFDVCAANIDGPSQTSALQIAVSLLRENRDVENREAMIDTMRGWFEKIQSESPDNLTVVIQRAEFEDVAADFKTAEKWLRYYMEQTEVSDRQRAIVANNLAYNLSLRGETEESFKLIKFAMTILGPTADLRDTLGVCYLAQNKPEEAITEFEAAIWDGGVTPFKHIHLAMAKMLQSDLAGAGESVKRAYELGLDSNLFNQLEFIRFQQMIEKLKEEGIVTDDDLVPKSDATLSS